jgi:hypothetical protein
MTEWRCYFETTDGAVITSRESWETPHEAATIGRHMLEEPTAFEFTDPDDFPVDGSDIDVSAGFTVESGDGEQSDPDELED